MRDVAVIGVGMIQFGRRDEDTLMDMLAYASLKALDDAGLGDGTVDAVYVGNMAAGMLQHQSAVASSLVDRLSLLPAAADVVENGPASGGSAVKNGLLAVASGYYDTVLVTGGEKMREVTGWRATDIVATMTHPEAEYPYGITLPGMAGMFTRLYMEKYGVTREMLVAVALKNQEIGALNPYAHVEMALDKDGIFNSPHSIVNNPMAADPLHLYDACPVSDGAAAIVITALDKIKNPAKAPVLIAGFGQATDTQNSAGARRPHRPESSHAGGAAGLRAGQDEALRHPRGRAARRLYHPGDRRERARRLLQEGRGRQGGPGWQDSPGRADPDQRIGRIEGTRPSGGRHRRGSDLRPDLAAAPRAA